MEKSHELRITRLSAVLIAAIIVVSLVAAASLGYFTGYSAIQGRIDDLQSQLSGIVDQNVTYILGENTSLPQLYLQVKESVVVIQGQIVQYDIFGRSYYSEVQGSGFVYDLAGQEVVITNYHVVESTVNITATFADGNGYAARVLGSDPYGDLAVLSADAPLAELKPLEIVNSSTLEVGDPVIAVGSPYGLAGSMTTGVVSALGRTITEQTGNGYPIASVIQTSTPINPGNSGGPLLDYQGQVVGITTAIVSNSQGLGFAIPSNTILREITSLVTNGSYDQHSWLEATWTDMTYEIAKAIGADATYGLLIATVSNGTGLRGGTSQAIIAGTAVTVGGDIVIAVNGTRIMNTDDLLTYLEEYTLPGQSVNVGIVRNNGAMTVLVNLGKRPSPSTA